MNEHTAQPSRRSVLRLLGAAVPAAPLAAGCGAGREPGPAVSSERPRPRNPVALQAGVFTPQQSALTLAAFDVLPGLRRDAVRRSLGELLPAWVAAGAAMAAGGSGEPEVAGLAPAGLTLTVGVGAGLPSRAGVREVPGLGELPPFEGDRLERAWSGGDLVVQLCADDPRVTERAATVLSRLGTRVVRPRWRQTGFLRMEADGGAPRNLFGFKDGMVQPPPSEAERHVWTDEGGTFMVVRRISMDVEGFARLPLAAQEAAVGRRRDSGAPLGGDEIDLFAKTPTGRYVIPAQAHVRRANPLAVGGAQMLRRGYNYRERGDQGLVFVSFQRAPETFVAIQRRLAGDAMMAHTTTVGSALFYVLPDGRADEPLGRGLLGNPIDIS
ncbi:dye decolorizing peroxidase [Sinosporangium album]|uniref:Dye decolorizing peroxidase n=1 Tax=Sinosporangium album TaxID=504805 RepID=A0A1G7S3R6_9ACTN|nr:Dyp-type peroxidase [Sinosporangium album]SDG17621.1 dye decolorizing peroxidase [Sinosporangium album]